jgi:hypothetical protein
MIFRYKQSNAIPKKWAKKQLENIRNFEVPETEPTRWDGRIDASTDTCDPFADNEPAQQASQTNTQVPHNNEEDLAYFKNVKRQVKYSEITGEFRFLHTEEKISRLTNLKRQLSSETRSQSLTSIMQASDNNTPSKAEQFTIHRAHRRA